MAKKTTPADVEAAAAEVAARAEALIEQHTAEIEYAEAEAAETVEAVGAAAATVPVPVDEIESAAALAEIEYAEAIESEGTLRDAQDAWNKVAERLYHLEHVMHQREGLRSSKLGRLLERLP